MRIGVPKEIKPDEHRVGLIPSAVRELTSRGHLVLVQSGAGAGSGFTDAAYLEAGATLAPDAGATFAGADMIVKVKEPQQAEWERLGENQILFTYLHLAPDPAQAEGLARSGCAAIAYETVTDSGGGLPLLAPMSEIAGRLSVLAAAHHLQKHNGGMGLLLPGAAGSPPARVTILGGGMVGTNAARMAVGLGAQVTALRQGLQALASAAGQQRQQEAAHQDRLQRELAAARADIEVAGRFIGEQHLRLVDERAGNGHALAFAARQLGGAVLEAMPEAAGLEELRRPVAQFGAPAGQPCEARESDERRQQRVLEHGELGKQVVELEHEADIAVSVEVLARGAEGAQILARERDRPGVRVGAIEPAEEMQERALAAA